MIDGRETWTGCRCIVFMIQKYVMEDIVDRTDSYCINRMIQKLIRGSYVFLAAERCIADSIQYILIKDPESLALASCIKPVIQNTLVEVRVDCGSRSCIAAMTHAKKPTFWLKLPPVKRRMTFLYGHKDAAACIADLSVGDQLGFDGRAGLGRRYDACFQGDRAVDRCRTKQLDVEFGSHRTWGVLLLILFH